MAHAGPRSDEPWGSNGPATEAFPPSLTESANPLAVAYDRFAHALLPPLQLAIRLWLGQIFFFTGLARLSDWQNQAFLFTEIHPVPFLPAAIAAPVTTAAELGLSACFMLGLLGRPAALGLLVMTMVIQWLVGQTPQGLEHGIAREVQLYWMALFALFALIGPGKWSLDAWLARGRG